MLNYRRFLNKLTSELLDALAESENAEWHHLEETDPRWVHYQRLATWSAELNERCVQYDYVQAANSTKNPKKVFPTT